MLKIKNATADDLPYIAELYLSKVYKGTTAYDYQVNYYSEKQRHLTKFKQYLNNSNKGIYIAYDEESILGFCIFEPHTHLSNCLHIPYIYTTIRRYIEIPRQRQIYLKLLFAVANTAITKKYSTMSIINNNYNYIKEVCDFLGAKSHDFIGMNYSYEETLLWNNLDFFQ